MEAQTTATHDTLWTSGWDSTFRVVDLARRPRTTVQPWYVIDPDRRSRHIEIQTMNDIRDRLVQKSPEIADRILPTKYIHKREIPANPKVTSAFRQLPGPERWGPQYEWLGRLVAFQGIKLEIGLKADDGPVYRLRKFLTKDPESGLFVFTIPEHHPAHEIFSGFTLPIVELSKTDMHNIAKERDFLDILNMTWFCQHPTLRGDACGLCIPCQHYQEEGLGHRLPGRISVLDHVEFHLVNKSWGLFTRARAILSKFLSRA